MTSDALSAIEAKIAEALRRRPECFIVHPTETRLLGGLGTEDLKKFANERGWRVVRRLGGRQFQFYNDTNERLIYQEGERPV
jgi:hypothetical protein